MLRLPIICTTLSLLVGVACDAKNDCAVCAPEATTTTGLDTSTTEADTTEADTTGTTGTTGAADESGSSDPSATGWETGGLSCEAAPVINLVDARLLPAADLPMLPSWADANGHVLILSSTPAICDAPLAGPTCGTGHEYRVFIALPSGFAPGIYYFGTFADGAEDPPDLGSWVVLSHAEQCEDGGQLPEGNYSKGAMLQVDGFDAVNSTVSGFLCGAYQPGLGDLAGTFAAQSCD